MNKSKFYILFFIIVLFSACAQIGSLTGGEKDTQPPVFTESSPENKGVNFSGNEIKITFDEFFVLENLNSVFLSSPLLLEKPEFKIKRKTLVIKLNEKLKDSTTYSFFFGNAIKDFHEGNVLNGFKFVFSTGNILDTMEISGKVADAFTHKPLADFPVMLYTDYEDSVPLLEKPFYITKTDTSGIFKIDFIKNGKYKIFALKDNDANFIYNLPGEKIAFSDSLFITKVKTETKTDTLKAGSILHEGNDDIKGDTLKNDTVIIHEEYVYSPQNIILFAFKEDKEKQYVSSFERPEKNKIVFQFALKTDDISINGLDFALNSENSYIEKTDTGKTFNIWLKDKNLFSKDTLKFTASFFNKDSANNKIKETDTLGFVFNFDADTALTYLGLLDANSDNDYFNDFVFEAESPVFQIDTSRIKLYELTDTLVADTKKQELLKYFRPAPDTLIFALRRPFVKDFFVIPVNFKDSANWYEKTYSANDTLLICRITDKKISEKDTLILSVNYDNDYFKNQIQHFKDTVVMPLFKQSLLSVKRPAPDTVILNFKKKVSSQTVIEPVIDNEENFFKKIKTKDDKTLKVIITNREKAEEDTLMLKIRTLDYDNTSGEKIYFEYVKNVIYKHKRQKIKSASRKEPDKIVLVFNKPLKALPEVTGFNTENTNNFEIKQNKAKDTVFCRILNPEIIKKDTANIIVTFNEKFKKKNITHIDTLSLIYKKQRKRHHRQRDNKTQAGGGANTADSTAQNKEKIVLETPVSFDIKKDSINERKLRLIFDKKQGDSYVLKLDSLALTDYAGNFSQTKEYKINVLKEDDYGKITLNISGVKFFEKDDFYFLNDTLTYDSTEYSVLSKGQIIMKIFDEKGNLTKEEILNEDTIVSYENIRPGTYKINLIYDRNKNGKQDTGNYLKHLQPERIIFFPDDIIVKPNWDNQTDIKFRILNKI